MSEFITKAELEEFKRELITELKNAEIETKEKTSGQLLKPIYNKWFHDTKLSYCKNDEKPFKQYFPVPHIWKVWDAIRAIVCAVSGSKTVAGIQDTGLALDFCEKLCEFIDGYMSNVKEAAHEKDTK